MKLLRNILVFACCAAALWTEAGYGNSIDVPPIDCAKPEDAVDTEICADKAMKEWWLDALFRDALALNPERRDAVNAAQREWTNLLKGCVDPEATLACAYALYDERMNAVITENLQPLWLWSAENPAEALAGFKSLTSPLARIYADLLTHALSDESIADFLTFAVGLSEQFESKVWKNGPDVILPCTLVEKYPRLLLLARPHFDIARDTQRSRPALDCVWDPVPTPVEDFLKHHPHALENWFERCGGENTTYRPWALYSFVVGDRMRYFPRSYLTNRLAATDAPDKPWPTPSSIDAWYSDPGYRRAQAALSTYYLLHFKMPPEESDIAAARALWDSRNTMPNPAICLDAP